MTVVICVEEDIFTISSFEINDSEEMRAFR